MHQLNNTVKELFEENRGQLSRYLKEIESYTERHLKTLENASVATGKKENIKAVWKTALMNTRKYKFYSFFIRPRISIHPLFPF